MAITTDERIKRLRTARVSVGKLKVVDLEGLTGSELKSVGITLRILDKAIKALTEGSDPK